MHGAFVYRCLLLLVLRLPSSCEPILLRLFYAVHALLLPLQSTEHNMKP